MVGHFGEVGHNMFYCQRSWQLSSGLDGMISGTGSVWGTGSFSVNTVVLEHQFRGTVTQHPRFWSRTCRWWLLNGGGFVGRGGGQNSRMSHWLWMAAIEPIDHLKQRLGPACHKDILYWVQVGWYPGLFSLLSVNKWNRRGSQRLLPSWVFYKASRWRLLAEYLPSFGLRTLNQKFISSFFGVRPARIPTSKILCNSSYTCWQ